MTGLEVVGGLVGNLPAPVQTSFFKAVGSLLGGLSAIPAAKLKQRAQAIEDTTAARSATAAALAKLAAENASLDPQIVQAAAEIYLPTTLRKAKNRLCVAQAAAEHLGGSASKADQPATPDEDWLNAFARFAEDASSEKLQDLFGRILAGQVVRPGSFALTTLRVVSELDQIIAEDFSTAWSKSVGTAVDQGPEYVRGEEYMRWSRLVEAGLMAPRAAVQHLPPYIPGRNGAAVWTPFEAEDIYLNVYYLDGCKAQWDHIDFTRVGRQIGSILPRPDYAANMSAAGRRLPRLGVIHVELRTPDNVEVLFTTRDWV